MKVRMLTDRMIGGKKCRRGDVIEVNELMVGYLLETRVVESAEAEPAPAKEKKKAGSDGPTV